MGALVALQSHVTTSGGAGGGQCQGASYPRYLSVLHTCQRGSHINISYQFLVENVSIFIQAKSAVLLSASKSNYVDKTHPCGHIYNPRYHPGCIQTGSKCNISLSLKSAVLLAFSNCILEISVGQFSISISLKAAQYLNIITLLLLL